MTLFLSAAVRENGHMSTASKETLRIDKWLWAARFTRPALATDAINGGRYCNGSRIAPAPAGVRGHVAYPEGAVPLRGDRSG
jgi:hypothetical protein